MRYEDRELLRLINEQVSLLGLVYTKERSILEQVDDIISLTKFDDVDMFMDTIGDVFAYTIKSISVNYGVDVTANIIKDTIYDLYMDIEKNRYREMNNAYRIADLIECKFKDTSILRNILGLYYNMVLEKEPHRDYILLRMVRGLSLSLMSKIDKVEIKHYNSLFTSGSIVEYKQIGGKYDKEH